MLMLLLHTVNALFCQHEWMTRTDSSRLYVECVRCLATSQGIDTRQECGLQSRLDVHAVDQNVHAVDQRLSAGRLAA